MVDLHSGGRTGLLAPGRTGSARHRIPSHLAPAHLLLGPPRHGVRLLASQLAHELGAQLPFSWHTAAEHPHVHLHVTSSLLEHEATDPAAALTWLAGRTRVTLTLHDVPQPSDGASFVRRRSVYRQLVRAVEGWAVSSHHERLLVHEHLGPRGDGLVAPLPVLPAARSHRPSGWSSPPPGPVVGLLGFVYPGKGHLEVLDVAARLRNRVRLSVVALGDVAQGHGRIGDRLASIAARRGVPFHVTGHLRAEELTYWMHHVDVAVCGHRNVSASGSTNSWISSGRRPLVRQGRYAREMAALRPGTSRLYRDRELPAVLLDALARPETTWIGGGVDTRPHLADTAQRYRVWWGAT